MLANGVVKSHTNFIMKNEIKQIFNVSDERDPTKSLTPVKDKMMSIQ